MILGCGFNAIATFEGASLTSPNWPDYYENNQTCDWWIYVDTGSRIEIIFESFELEDGYDFLVRIGENL